MSNKNLLTDEECEIILEMSKKPQLNLEGVAGRDYGYKGIAREPNIEDIKTIEEILIKWCPDLVSFSNFTGQSPNRIRIQIWYSDDHSFRGAHYLKMPSNKEEDNV